MLKYFSDATNAPAAIGPYSQAVVANNFAFLSGQIPLDPKTMKLVEGGIEEQTRQVFSNIQAVLSHVGADFSRIAKTTIFLTDLGDFQTVNKIYAEFMKDSKPARSTVQVAALPLGSKIEIEVIVALS